MDPWTTPHGLALGSAACEAQVVVGQWESKGKLLVRQNWVRNASALVDEPGVMEDQSRLTARLPRDREGMTEMTQ